MKLSYKIIILLAVLLSSCSKYDQDILPPVTQIGANTFGCKIDGKSFYVNTNCNEQFFSKEELNYVSMKYDSTTSTIKVRAYSYDIEVDFSFKYDGGIGKYTNIKDALTDSESYIHITRKDNVFSGYFEITYPNVRYTEGRFDFKIKNGILSKYD